MGPNYGGGWGRLWGNGTHNPGRFKTHRRGGVNIKNFTVAYKGTGGPEEQFLFIHARTGLIHVDKVGESYLHPYLPPLA